MSPPPVPPEGTGIPESARASQEPVFLVNRPNPFDSQTTLSYSIREEAHVELCVFDVRGRLVRVLEAGRRSPGVHHLTWGGLRHDGTEVPPGIYFVRLETGSETLARKVVLAEGAAN